MILDSRILVASVSSAERQRAGSLLELTFHLASACCATGVVRLELSAFEQGYVEELHSGLSSRPRRRKVPLYAYALFVTSARRSLVPAGAGGPCVPLINCPPGAGRAAFASH